MLSLSIHFGFERVELVPEALPSCNAISGRCCSRHADIELVHISGHVHCYFYGSFATTQIFWKVLPYMIKNPMKIPVIWKVHTGGLKGMVIRILTYLENCKSSEKSCLP